MLPTCPECGNEVLSLWLVNGERICRDCMARRSGSNRIAHDWHRFMQSSEKQREDRREPR